MGHTLMENRHGLLVDGRVSEANGTAERDEAAAMTADVPGRHRITVAGDKGFDTTETSSPPCASSTSHRMSPKTPPVAARPSTAGPPGIPATREPTDPQADRGSLCP